MKNLLLAFALILSVQAFAQDSLAIVVNLSDNAKLQYGGSNVKMKATVLDYRPLINATKDFYIKVRVTYYINNAGAYGATVLSTIFADGTLSDDQKQSLSAIYSDQIIDWQTTDKYVNASGDIVPKGTSGSQREIFYWQAFKLNQVSGMGTLAGQSAIGAEYLIINAIVTKLNSRKKW